jgi:transposase
VKRARASAKEVFVPLSHPPGHAQFDFGEAVVEIAGARTKAALGLITLPYSDTCFAPAYPRECTETFQAAHVAGFEFFGAVPRRTSYDRDGPPADVHHFRAVVSTRHDLGADVRIQSFGRRSVFVHAAQSHRHEQDRRPAVVSALTGNPLSPVPSRQGRVS